MELDDFKQAWKETPEQNNIHTDIMELIKHKSYGPVAALKRVYRKQILLMALLPFMLLVTNLDNIEVPLTSIMFWSYVAFCITAIVFAAYNYHIAAKMELMDGQVKDNLQQQIAVLEKRSKWELAGIRGVLIFFIVLTETVPYLQHYRLLDKWHSLHPAIRFGCYAFLLVVQYFLNRRIKQRKVGRHLDYLRSLVSELKD